MIFFSPGLFPPFISLFTLFYWASVTKHCRPLHMIWLVCVTSELARPFCSGTNFEPFPSEKDSYFMYISVRWHIKSWNISKNDCCALWKFILLCEKNSLNWTYQKNQGYHPIEMNHFLFIYYFFNTHNYFIKTKNKTHKNVLRGIWTADPWSGKQWWRPIYHVTHLN